MGVESKRAAEANGARLSNYLRYQYFKKKKHKMYVGKKLRELKYTGVCLFCCFVLFCFWFFLGGLG